MKPTLKIELWYEEEAGPQFKTHITHEGEIPTAEDYAEIQRQMESLRDRLTQEIEKGPTCCPFAPSAK